MVGTSSKVMLVDNISFLNGLNIDLFWLHIFPLFLLRNIIKGLCNNWLAGVIERLKRVFVLFHL